MRMVKNKRGTYENRKSCAGAALRCFFCNWKHRCSVELIVKAATPEQQQYYSVIINRLKTGAQCQLGFNALIYL